MNKEHLIRELKYTKEKHKNDKLHTFDTDISAMCNDVLDVLSRCVEIPDNATNQEEFIKVFGIDAWQQIIVFSGLADQFKEFWTSSY